MPYAPPVTGELFPAVVALTVDLAVAVIPAAAMVPVPALAT